MLTAKGKCLLSQLSVIGANGQYSDNWQRIYSLKLLKQKREVKTLHDCFRVKSIKKEMLEEKQKIY